MAADIPPPRTNVLALVGFVAAFVVPVAGLVASILARRQLSAPGNREGGHGLARWGVFVGALGCIVQGAFIVIWLTMFLRFAAPGAFGG